MEIIKTLVWILNLVSALTVIVLILMQHGKGADAGAAFGSGASSGLFGSAGSANFMSRFTAVAAVIFFSTCIGLTLISGSGSGLGVMESGAAKSIVEKNQTQAPGKVIPE